VRYGLGYSRLRCCFFFCFSNRSGGLIMFGLKRGSSVCLHLLL